MTTVKVNVKFGEQSQNTSLVSFEAQLAKPEVILWGIRSKNILRICLKK